jgi:single-stranded-DNA-specific exonuclease
MKDKKIDLTRVSSEIIPLIGSAAYIDPSIGVKIFICNNEDFVKDAVERLSLVNEERRKGIDALFKEAISKAKIYPRFVISVIGFLKHHYLSSVSSRLKDYAGRTSIVIGLKDQKCYGELRSYDLDLHKMLSELNDFFLDFGGHKKAAGFSMVRENLEKLIDEVVKYVSEYGSRERANGTSKLCPEAFLKKEDIEMLKPIMPFGEGNPSPILTDGTNLYTINNRLKIIDKGL